VGKIADQYLEIDPWKLIEEGFHPERGQVSESLFSLANEHQGVRGFFDEGYTGKSLIDLLLASTQYRANSRVISTAQTLLDDLLNMRR